MNTQAAKFARGLERLETALEGKFAGIYAKQVLRISTGTRAPHLDDRKTAVEHALWTLKSIMSYATEGSMRSAHADMCWLCRFMRANGLNLKAA